MQRCRFVANRAAFRELMNGPAVVALISKSTAKMAAFADSVGSGRYDHDVMPGRVSPHGMVKTTDVISRNSNAKHNTLRKSIDAGRV